ncbi:unnamed protein product, partial [Scytosiphon promiscuus]
MASSITTWDCCCRIYDRQVDQQVFVCFYGGGVIPFVDFISIGVDNFCSQFCVNPSAACGLWICYFARTRDEPVSAFCLFFSECRCKFFLGSMKFECLGKDGGGKSPLVWLLSPDDYYLYCFIFLCDQVDLELTDSPLGSSRGARGMLPSAAFKAYSVEMMFGVRLCLEYVRAGVVSVHGSGGNLVIFVLRFFGKCNV